MLVSTLLMADTAQTVMAKPVSVTAQTFRFRQANSTPVAASAMAKNVPQSAVNERIRRFSRTEKKAPKTPSSGSVSVRTMEMAFGKL